jgi:uncharacterized protein (DUF2267 family)
MKTGPSKRVTSALKTQRHQRHTSPGEIDDVKHVMPKSMQELWR